MVKIKVEDEHLPPPRKRGRPRKRVDPVGEEAEEAKPQEIPKDVSPTVTTLAEGTEGGDKTNSDPCELKGTPEEENTPTDDKKEERFMKVYTDFFVAPPTGYEEVEIEGLEKFCLLGNQLVPYSEWKSVQGDVSQLNGVYPEIPAETLKTLLDTHSHQEPTTSPGLQTLSLSF